MACHHKLTGTGCAHMDKTLFGPGFACANGLAFSWLKSLHWRPSGLVAWPFDPACVWVGICMYTWVAVGAGVCLNNLTSHMENHFHRLAILLPCISCWFACTV